MDQSQTSLDKPSLPAFIDTAGQKESPKKSTKRRRAMALALLTSNPSLTRKEIAKMAGTCKKTVDRIAAEIKSVASENLVEADRMAYRTLISERVPMEKRVEGILGQIADVRFALPAIKYVDQVLGVGPIAESEQPQKPQPMFSFAGDASISVTINQTSVRNPALDTTTGCGLPLDNKPE